MNFEEHYFTEEKNNKLIVYHGTNNKFSKFNFNTSLQKIIWFTSNIESIKDGSAGAQGNKYVIKMSVNIKNPAGWNEYEKYSLDELQSMGYDGVILPNKNGYDGFVFKPSQVKMIEWIE